MAVSASWRDCLPVLTWWLGVAAASAAFGVLVMLTVGGGWRVSLESGAWIVPMVPPAMSGSVGVVRMWWWSRTVAATEWVLDAGGLTVRRRRVVVMAIPLAVVVRIRVDGCFHWSDVATSQPASQFPSLTVICADGTVAKSAPLLLWGPRERSDAQRLLSATSESLTPAG